MEANASPIENTGHARPSTPAPSSQEFAPGSTVFYGVHGRCTVTSVETRNVGQQPARFYRLEVQRTVPANTHKKDTTIWLPVASAASSGLRAPLSASEAQSVFEVLESAEYYFSVKTPWQKAQAELEAIIRKEGAVGLAKALSYLHVLKSREAVPPKNMLRFAEAVYRMLMRELLDATGAIQKDLETRVDRLLRQKLRLDT